MDEQKFRKHKFTFSERWAVYEAYEHICIYCRCVVHWKDFEVDHIIKESLLKEPDKLAFLIEDYGLGSEFSINCFQNWACTHHYCNRVKGNTTVDKSRALHYLQIAERKAKSAERIHKATESANNANKVLATLRALIENGTLTRQEIADFANAIVRNADVGLNNPVVMCFGLAMDDVYQDLPEDAPDSPPYIYDWLENNLTQELQRQLGCKIELWESQRTGETISARYAFWDLDLNKLNSLKVRWWEILELALHSEIYEEFVSKETQSKMSGDDQPAV